MTNTKRSTIAIAVSLLGLGCSSSSAPPAPDSSEGGESTLPERVNTAHADFKQTAQPVASELDRVANESVNESKEAIRKLTGSDEAE